MSGENQSDKRDQENFFVNPEKCIPIKFGDGTKLNVPADSFLARMAQRIGGISSEKEEDTGEPGN